MTLHSRYFPCLFLALLCACNRSGGVQQAINTAEANARDTRDDADVRSVRLQELADQLNAEARATGGARARALAAEARRDSNSALSVRQAGQAKADEIENTIGADFNAAQNR